MSAPLGALALIRSGDTPRAITYLRALNDPRLAGAIALLEHGFADYAAWCLEALPAQDVARVEEAA